MIFKSRKTHIISTLLLMAVIAVPAYPMATNSAYGDTETSGENVLQASAEFPNNDFRVEVNPFMLQAAPEAADTGEVEGTTTPETAPEEKLPEVEVSEEPLEVIEEEPTTEEPAVEVSDEPLEVVETEEEPTEEPAQEKEEALDPEEDAAPAPETATE